MKRNPRGGFWRNLVTAVVGGVIGFGGGTSILQSRNIDQHDMHAVKAEVAQAGYFRKSREMDNFLGKVRDTKTYRENSKVQEAVSKIQFMLNKLNSEDLSQEDVVVVVEAFRNIKGEFGSIAVALRRGSIEQRQEANLLIEGHWNNQMVPLAGKLVAYMLAQNLDPTGLIPYAREEKNTA